jgi:oligosaccharyltransferase complex subunit delta (ribophorin II)
LGNLFVCNILICFRIFIGFLLLAVACLHSEAARPINSHLSGSDLDRLNRVFQDGIKSNDLQTIFYSAVYGKELDLAAVKEACQRLEKLHADSKLNVST